MNFKNSIEAVIFDFDGLIIDSESPRFRAWRRTYRQFGGRLTLADYALNVGSDDARFDFRKNLEASYGRPIPWEEVDIDRRAYYGKLMSMVKPFPGIVRLIREAEYRGLKLAVASSSPADWVKPLLEKHGLAGSFDVIVNAGDGLAAKPEPDVYRQALSLLGVNPECALAFEDSPNGLLAARRAGIACVIVPNRVTRRLAFDRPDLVLRPRRAYSLEKILAKVDDR